MQVLHGVAEEKSSAARTNWPGNFKGFLIEGFTAIRSAMGTEGALKAMRSNERKTNQDYSDALSLDMPADVRAIVQRNYEDERRHLGYVEETLRARVWESVA